MDQPRVSIATALGLIALTFAIFALCLALFGWRLIGIIFQEDE